MIKILKYLIYSTEILRLEMSILNYTLKMVSKELKAAITDLEEPII